MDVKNFKEFSEKSYLVGFALKKLNDILKEIKNKKQEEILDQIEKYTLLFKTALDLYSKRSSLPLQGDCTSSKDLISLLKEGFSKVSTSSKLSEPLESVLSENKAGPSSKLTEPEGFIDYSIGLSEDKSGPSGDLINLSEDKAGPSETPTDITDVTNYISNFTDDNIRNLNELEKYLRSPKKKGKKITYNIYGDVNELEKDEIHFFFKL